MMLQQLLDPSRWEVEIVFPHLLVSEALLLVETRTTAAVCIGALPSGGLAAHTRHLCKRLRARFPELKILVGRWGGEASSDAVVEIVAGDVQDSASLARALAGCDVAYYLVHSMGAGGEFEDADRRAATSFGRAARMAGVRRIIYLGGLGSGRTLSPHLASRQEVGRLLAVSGVPTIEFRASIVIGCGSLSFEIIRALVERLPVMVAPRWVRTPTQPIAVEDLIAYLLAGLDLDATESRVFEIGGADVVSYEGLMKEYAQQRGLRRLLLPVPVLSPALSSLWLGLVTPLYARVGRTLIDSLRNATVVTDDGAHWAFTMRPRGYREAIARALANEDRELAETRWSDAPSSGGLPRSWPGVRFASRFVDSRAIRVAAPPRVAFEPIARIGGSTGWYAGDSLWRLRGFLDRLTGGVGLRRGRRDPGHLIVGDALDCWRVEAIEPGRLLRLAAEMRLPGRAWLVFEVEPDVAGSVIRQTALFDPVGLRGLAYWCTLFPVYRLVFGGMLRGIGERVRRGAGSQGPSQSPGRPRALVHRGSEASRV
jgi:uncharacterized protein YbjT (DUF2867 family)